MAEFGIVFTVDGTRYELNLAEVTGRDSREFRAATGESLRRTLDLFVMHPDDVDIDTVAGIVWLARRQAGEKVEYDTVLGEINYHTTISSESSEVTVPQP